MVVSPSAANIGTPHRHNGKAETATLRFINTRLALRIVEAMRPLPVHLFFALNPQHTLHPLRITRRTAIHHSASTLALATAAGPTSVVDP